MAGFLRGGGGGAERSAYGAPAGGAGRAAYGSGGAGGAGYASSMPGGAPSAGYGASAYGAGASYEPRRTAPPASSAGYPAEKQPAAPAHGGGYLIVKCPDALVLSNCLVVNAQEWAGTQYVLVDGRFVFTAA
jgi:vesicle-fusing ATPase